MDYHTTVGFPSQQLPFSRKNTVWRKKCVDFGDHHSLLHHPATRKSVAAMQINYDLLRGKLYMEDLKASLNPFNIDASFIPDGIQHYASMNAKLRVLEGEEIRRLFDYRVVVTNPNAISEIEEEKNKKVNESFQQLLMDSSIDEEEYQRKLEKNDYYFKYEYQDKREVRGNLVLNHYVKELDIPQLFLKGFRDATTVGEEIYQCDIVGGEPYVRRIDPRKIRIIKSGTSCNVEDADVIVLEDYWSPGRVIDTYWDQLSKKEIEKIENAPNHADNTFYGDSGRIEFTYRYPERLELDWTAGDAVLNPLTLFDDSIEHDILPYDLNGNIRVLQVYWKSRRKIKKVKSYNPETGEEQFNFYPETYYCDPDKGEEEQVFWINEAWEGVKIGTDIYINMRPRPVQYNRLSNPSRCHFGIIGSIYSSDGESPFSLVDIMKSYAYYYDVIMDRLNKTLARNVGKVVRLDFAKVPDGWDTDKWLYYLNVNGIAVENSFNEGSVGRATGVLAGSLNNASSGVIDASLGNEIIQYTNLLQWIDSQMGKLIGMTDQRLGQISNRETVGGVERATLQSSHSTEWLFFIHDSVKKRVLECLLETAKIAFKGRKVKFEYILSDGSKQIIEVDGDEFAECDYGLVVDNSNGAVELNQKLDTLAQAGLQNGLIDFSTMMKMFTTTSMAEKQRIVEACENRMREQQQQQQQQQLQLQQQQMQIQQRLEQQKQQLQYQMHLEDNETKILVAQINSVAEEKRFAMIQEENGITKQQELEFKQKQLELDSKQFDAKLKLEEKKHKDNTRIKEKQINNK